MMTPRKPLKPWLVPTRLASGVPLSSRLTAEMSWYWALNGIFGVLCSALAVLISIYVAISVNFYIAAACYTAVLGAQIGLRRANEALGVKA